MPAAPKISSVSRYTAVMSRYREDRSPRCAACEQTTPIEELTFNSSGDPVCRRCAASATIEVAQAYEQKHGMARRCPNCEARMIGSDERDVRRVVVDGEESTQLSWSHKFDCTQCGHSVRFTPLPMVLVYASPFVVVGGYLASVGELLSLFLLVPGILMLLYAFVLRVRYPVWPSDQPS